MKNPQYQTLISTCSLEELKQDSRWSVLIQDEYFVYELITKTSFDDFDLLPRKIQENPLLVLMMMERIQHHVLPDVLKKDRIFCMHACSMEPRYVGFFEELVENEEDMMWWYLEHFVDLPCVQYLPAKYRARIDVANYCLEHGANNYEFFSPELRDDVELYDGLSLKKKCIVFPYAGPRIKSSTSHCMEVITEELHLYRQVCEELKKSPAFFLELLNVSADKQILKYACDTIKDNENCVWQATLAHEHNLFYASQRLLNSTSFATQVLQSMASEHFLKVFSYFSASVKNHKHTVMQLMPQIVQFQALGEIGYGLKTDMDVMLAAAMIDSQQALMNCSKHLLEDSNFFIRLYGLLNEKNHHLGQYDDDSEQSIIFNFITQDSCNNSTFLAHLYLELGDIFLNLVYDKISHYKNPLIQYLNVARMKERGLKEAMDKMVLNVKLNKALEVSHTHNKKTKI